jgi:hypothetical protein
VCLFRLGSPHTDPALRITGRILFHLRSQKHRWDVHYHNISTVMTNSDAVVEKQHWLDTPHACQLADVSSSGMRVLIEAGVLRACQSRVPGKVWGKRIINKESLLGKLAANQRKAKSHEEV